MWKELVLPVLSLGGISFLFGAGLASKNLQWKRIRVLMI